MPALPNIRQERFCLKVAQGIPPYRAYEEAGYKKHESNCYRMSENERVKERLLELCGTHEAQELASRDRIIRELASIAFTPIGSDVVKVADKRQSLMDIAKLEGHVIERKQHDVSGSITAITDPGRLIDLIAQRLELDTPSAGAIEFSGDEGGSGEEPS